MEEKKKQRIGNAGRGRIALICGAVLLIGCAWILYYRNLPSQRVARALREADAFFQDESYEEAASAYERALAIDGTNMEAAEGYARAGMALAEEAAKSEDIPGRAKACRMLEGIIAFCDEKNDSALAEGIRKSAADRLDGLRREIAADYDSVTCTNVRDDRSGKVVLADGTQIPYTWFYDLVQIEDEDYPLADMINALLESRKNAFFAGDQTNPSVNISGAGPAVRGNYSDYVGAGGIYSQNGLLSIRMAEIRTAGKSRAGFFCGTTFRLSDAKELTLGEVLERTDSGLRHLVRKKMQEWFEKGGYSSVSMSEAEKYLEKTDPEELKFFIREDGMVCLVIDQEMPFFSSGDEILEIPLDKVQETEGG